MLRRDVMKTALGAGALAMPGVARAQGSRVLTFVPYADVGVVDPVVSTAYSTRTHVLAVFDTLYGTDENLNPHPQMAAGHVVGDDGLTWRITLREGLRFHDGTPVLARDCVASLRRWGRRDAFGQAVMDATNEMVAADDNTLVFRLKRPFPLLPAALGRPSSLVPAIMPERLATTDAFTQVTEVVGSGPFRYVAEERLPGARVVYARHEGYVPRPDGTPSFTAGPRIAHVDRVVFNVIADPGTAASALQTGDVDWVEQALIDLVPRLRRSRDIVVEVKDRTGVVGCLRFNTLHPPFDKPAIRRAVLEAVDQAACMQAAAGSDPAFWVKDIGFFPPDSPMASPVGFAQSRRPIAALRAAVRDAGYNGERVAMMVGADVPRINAVSEVTREVLVQLGLNVDYQTTDWNSVIGRLTNRRPVGEGGWSCYCTYWSGMDQWTPGPHAFLRANGARGASGWPDSPAIEALRADWLAAPDEVAQRRVAAALQREAEAFVPYVPLGIARQPTAYRRNLTGMLNGAPVFTNLRKG